MTTYVPVEARLLSNPFEVVVLGRDQGCADLRPEVWGTTPGAPFIKRRLTLKRCVDD